MLFFDQDRVSGNTRTDCSGALRSATPLLRLPDVGFRFLDTDTPKVKDHASEIIAFVALADREAIARWTEEALALAKARGIKLGNTNGAENPRWAGKGGVALRAAVSANAAAFAADLAPALADIRANRHASLRTIAAELTARAIRTRLGGNWDVGNVRALFQQHNEMPHLDRVI